MGGSKRKHNASATVFTAPKKEDCTYYEVARDKLIADLAAAVKAGDVRGMMKITYFVDGLPLFGFSKLHEMISTNDTYIENYDRAMKPYDTWRANIKAGDNVDTLREEESIWYDTRVLEIDHKKDTMKVHYLGWDSKYDEQLSVSGTVVIPQNTFSVGKKKPVRVRQIEEKLPAETDLNVAAVPPIDGEELKEVEGASSGELGRGSRRRASSSRASSSSAAAGAVEGGEEAETGAGEGEKKDRESKPKEEKDLNDWICGICGWLEAEDGSDLVLCEAFCRRSFHLGCMRGKMVLPKPEEKQWYCADCRSGHHACFLCKQSGQDHLEVYKCSVSACGKYYHQACLRSASIDFIVPPMKISAKKDVAVVLPIHGSSSSTSTSTSSAVPTASSAADSVTASAVSADVVVKKGRGRPKASTVVADAKASAQASSVATSSIGSTATPMPAPVTAVVSPAVDGSPRSTRGIKLDFRALLGASSSPSATSSAAVPAVAAVEAVDPAVAGAAAQQARQEAEAAAQQARQEAEYRELEHTTGHLCYEIKRVSVLNCLTFKCPQHYCNNCYDFYGAKDGCDINKCLACARAFHVNCIPPGSRFNSVCLLCPRHPDDPLPSHEMRLDPRTKRPKSTSNMFTQFWEQLAIPDVLPNANDPYDNHFKLQQHIRDDVAGAAAPFTVISRNDYSFMAGKNTAPKFIPEVRCECKIDCDENCLNRILRIECCDTKIKTAGESGDMAICNVGPGCTNRALQKHRSAKTEPFREFKMGYGLRAKEHIYEGQFVMEYVGEVIDHAEVQRRMTSQRELTPLDKDFYIMELDNGVFVDGKFRGSTSRFINHSCDPNCELQRWVVKGMPRIGIFAIRDIAPGEALSYDYQFDTKEDEAFKCYCGTEKCRGTMAPKKKKALLFDANGRPQSREERVRLILMGKSKENLSRETLIEAEWARSYTGKFVPGDIINEVKNGPVKSTLAPGRDAHIFLCRTIKRSSNFFQRDQLLRKKQRSLEASGSSSRSNVRRGGSSSKSRSRSPRGKAAGVQTHAQVQQQHFSTDGDDATAPGLMMEEEDDN